jgi:hypothetical protein
MVANWKEKIEILKIVHMDYIGHISIFSIGFDTVQVFNTSKEMTNKLS